MVKYDLLVIGFGKAGKTLATTLAKEGKKVAVVEENSKMYGGTCINIGCIPTKTLIVAAENKKSYAEAKATRDKVVSKLNAKNFAMLNNNPNIDIYTAKAKFISNKVIEIFENGETKQLEGEVIVINTGAKNNTLNIPGLTTSKNVYDSTELQKLKTPPKTLGILGGGNIGLEFSNLYSKLGVKVTLIDFSPTVLGREDTDISILAQKYLKEQGVEFKLGTATKEIRNNGNKVIVDTEKYGNLEFDALLHATGRRANTEDLGLENTDIKLAANGSIVVDEFCRTNVENIFAVGDVNGGLQFTYVSLDDFRIVNNYLHGNKEYTRLNRENIPYSVFITPTLSRVGLNENQARKLYKNIAVASLHVANMPRGAVNQDQRGIYKVIVDKDTNLILGATLFSKNSEEIINLIKLAMDNNIPYTYIKNQVFTHPAMAENLNDVFKLI
ncbi:MULTISPECIES: FAD-containing oxidoreductase [Gemella]|uniref:FAD-containing oxidoreductase n=1 Tax=Gemella TaxID=1378 RepID=UPI0007681604|nr:MULTISPECIES: FAD-containing oxidoreductase [Gemella]AME08834.1 pyridine nucleotide-disulfide oxidoreductase [Gemella sp. oral taxon 928]AXI26404.1 pyridine nucleotide-disulfide oxidoreductase [Gemella sp. ND 6198]